MIKIKDKLEKFLLSNDNMTFDYIDEEREYFNYKFLKLPFNHRFDMLYQQRLYLNKMDNGSFSFAGYYDKIDKTIYNPSYELGDYLKDKSIKKDYFDYLKMKIIKGINGYIKNYIINNQDKLKKEYHDDFYEDDKYRIDNAKKFVEQFFITNDLNNIELPNFIEIRYNEYVNYENILLFDSKLIYTEYLDNPIETIKQKTELILEQEDAQKNLGYMLNKNEFENNYLEKIITNETNEFDSLHINKKLYSSIKDIDAQNINITINYDGDEITFKFYKDSFQSYLANNDKCQSGYNKAYEPVKEFLKEHKDPNNWYKDSFDFVNISKITYGKNVLYGREIETSKELENEIEMEME